MRRSFSLLLLFVGCLTLASAAQAGPPLLSAGQLALLSKGKPIIKALKPTGGDGIAAHALAIIDAEPHRVFDVINACEHFSKFMPRTKKSSIVKREGPNQKICHTEISMPFPFSNLVSDVRSISKELPGGGFERRWTMLKGNYKRNNGHWEIWPHNNGAQSLVVYRMDIDPDMALPDAIIRKAQTSSLPKVFKAIEKRVKSL